jgi:RimJ/RimL family protein N-acetyltransferase
VRNLRRGVWLLRKGHLRTLLRRIRRLAWYDATSLGATSLGLAYDPREPVTTRVPRVEIEVRLLEESDIPVFTSLPPAGSPRVEALTRTNARDLIESGLQTCYVGVTEDGPVYMQFLVTADQNERLLAIFGGLFPPLVEDEGLLEFAFTLQEHRARPVMPAVLLRLIEIAAERGLRRVVTYVHVNNPSFIRFFMRLGFVPFVVRGERWRLFRRRVEFCNIDPRDAERFVEAKDFTALAALGLTSMRM